MPRHDDLQNDWMMEIQQDYKNIVALVKRMEDMVTLTMKDGNKNRLAEVLEGFVLLKKVMGIEGL